MNEGIDISRYQNVRDWTAVKSAGIAYVHVKATEGATRKELSANGHALGATRVGIPLGYYHFAHPGKNPARVEANNFATALRSLPDAQLLPILDLEVNELNIKPVAMEAWIEEFRDEFLALTAKPLMLYSYTPFLNTNLPEDSKAHAMKLCIAQYNNKPQPILPRGWSSYAIWQYTGEGALSGIENKVDRSRCPDLALILL